MLTLGLRGDDHTPTGRALAAWHETGQPVVLTMTRVQALSKVGSGGRVHLSSLDGLRGVSVLAVLLFHTGHLSGEFLEVDLCFALSGYLITGLLLREVEATGTVSLVAFWSGGFVGCCPRWRSCWWSSRWSSGRRVRRIWCGRRSRTVRGCS
ncbi:hypothetical protein GCM10011581_17150 [Saccharopolyspora subtropica]|uniref:Acyltransferase n=1 Tax=Saccharopolyspora thermophila TaxID=89367 RepID=A0A917JRN3_9PSEU|nr:hypothetical protein GCM10011581_17150 [Saccharopolyspora subtropica]